MTRHNRTTNMVEITVGIISILGAALIPNTTTASEARPGAVRPDRVIFGMTYGDWSAAWWQWVLSVPATDNPLNDLTGEICGIQQTSGPVFFLVGTIDGTEVERDCTVPAGKAIFFPILNLECSTLEEPPFHGGNEARLRDCAARWANGIGVKTMQVTVDGREIKRLWKYRVQSPVFDITLPEDNIIGIPPGKGSSASDGYWVMLPPLTPGAHLIHYEGAFVSGTGAGFTQNATYHVTVTN